MKIEKELVIGESSGRDEYLFGEARGIAVDDSGRIFVQTWEKTKDGKAYMYDVFNSDGICMAKVPLSSEPKVWKKNKLYTIEEDEEGYQYVVRYKVVWE